ncbi:hypothetical protein [Microcella sp.]|uniref:hypothetical protein n=1 Tax=Microcella sp. TaxID=1913979 RepID=UPI003919CE2F
MTTARSTTHPHDPARHPVHTDEGVAVGSAFLGWLTATGAALLLTALVASIGAAIGLGNANTAEEAVEGALAEATTIGVVGAIILALVLFIAYVAGGYVAGRMARVSGIMQGFVVWLWAVVFAIVVGVLAAVGGTQLDGFARVDGFPLLPLTGTDLTATTIITAVVIAVVSLAGAILGSAAGTRHRHTGDPNVVAQ